jgi:hypothetical protein
MTLSRLQFLQWLTGLASALALILSGCIAVATPAPAQRAPAAITNPKRFLFFYTDR